MISPIYFLKFSIAFFLMILHILRTPFAVYSRGFPSFRFLIRARVADRIIDFNGLLNAIVTLMRFMVSLVGSMSSTFCSV